MNLTPGTIFKINLHQWAFIPFEVDEYACRYYSGDLTLPEYEITDADEMHIYPGTIVLLLDTIGEADFPIGKFMTRGQVAYFPLRHLRHYMEEVKSS